MTFKIEWIDSGREPQSAPDPNFPDGRDVLAALPGPACTAKLTYPARRCGRYMVKCSKCGVTAAVTTAGRADDPRSITINCRATLH